MTTSELRNELHVLKQTKRYIVDQRLGVWARVSICSAFIETRIASLEVELEERLSNLGSVTRLPTWSHASQNIKFGEHRVRLISIENGQVKLEWLTPKPQPVPPIFKVFLNSEIARFQRISSEYITYEPVTHSRLDADCC